MEVDVSRELVDSWFEAFRKRDLSKLVLAEDFIHTSPYGKSKAGMPISLGEGELQGILQPHNRNSRCARWWG